MLQYNPEHLFDLMTEFNDSLKKLLEDMVCSFVDFPGEVRVEIEDAPRGVTLHVVASQKDMGLLIGKGGQMFRSLHTIIRSAGSKQQRIVNLFVKEPPLEMKAIL